MKQFRGQPLEVTVSLLDFENANPAMMACLPESERWHMAVKDVVFKAPQSELYKKYPDLRQASIERILSSCQSAHARWSASRSAPST